MSIAGRVKEWFSLSEAAEEARRRPAAAREAVAEGLALGRQRADAAEALWSNGHASEGLRLAVDALDCTLGAAEALGVAPAAKAPKVEEPPPAAEEEATDEDDAGSAEPDPESAESESEEATEEAAEEEPEAPEPDETPVDESAADWESVLRSRGLDAERVQRVKMAKASLSEAALPLLDGAVSAAHAELYKDVSRGRQDADRVLSSASLTVGQIRWKRMQRWATALGLLTLAVVGLYLAVRTPERVFTSASSFFRNDPQFSPDNVFDGDERTEWLLNDRQGGWVEGRLSPPRSISKVEILNGHNRHYNDRAVRAYKIELFDSSGAKLTEFEGEFERLVPAPEWVAHEAQFDDVERIRITVSSFHRLGGALAEVRWQER